MSFLKKIGLFFSFVFHPVFIPLFVIFIDYNEFLNPVNQQKLVLQIVLVSIVLPLLFLIYLKKTKQIDTLSLFNSNERKAPLLFQIVLFTVFLFFHYSDHQTFKLVLFFEGATLTLIAALVFVIFQIKASLHVASLSSLLFFAIGLYYANALQNGTLIVILLFFVFVVGLSRWILKAHTVKEIVIGFCIGALPQLLLFSSNYKI